MKKRASFHNLGCKVNAYEMDVMIGLFEEEGYEIVPFTEPADVVVINTCTVTNIADRKSRQMIHRAKKLNPDAVVVAAGCYVQADAERALKDAGIDICIGNPDKPRIVELVEGRSRDEEVSLKLTHLSEHSRAYIKIQDGCNQFCSYCIIPFARGRVRSRDKEEILREIRGLTVRGVKEFVITGIHISSYGYDLEHPQETPKADRFAPERLLDLLKSIDEINGVERIRLGSLEPRIISREFAEGLKGLKAICPHFHLSLQSGSSSVLKRMNRHYTPEEYALKVSILREVFDDPAITTDVIVGFPGETEEEFEESLRFAEETGFYQMHIFRYSKRKGTVAANMPGQLTEAQKAERSDRMEEAEHRMTAEYIKRHAGKKAEVLYEEEKLIGGRRMMTGYTREYIRAAVETKAAGGTIKQIMTGDSPEDGILTGVEL